MPAPDSASDKPQSNVKHCDTHFVHRTAVGHLVCPGALGVFFPHALGADPNLSASVSVPAVLDRYYCLPAASPISPLASSLRPSSSANDVEQHVGCQACSPLPGLAQGAGRPAECAGVQGASLCSLSGCGGAASCRVPLLQGSRLESSRDPQAKQVALQSCRKHAQAGLPSVTLPCKRHPCVARQAQGCCCALGCRRTGWRPNR